MDDTLKILIIGDLHGQKPNIYIKDYDIIIATGDFCDDKKIGKFYKEYFAYLKTIKNKQIKKKPNFEDFINQKIGQEKYEKYEKESLKVGRKILEYLNSLGKPVFIVPGNWDQSYGSTKIKDMYKNSYNNNKTWLDWYLSNKTNTYLTQNLENIYDCQYKLHKLDKFNIIGYGLSSGPEKLIASRNLTKSKTTNKKIKILIKAYKKLNEKLNKKYKQHNPDKPTIFLTHNIPYNTKLDIINNKKSIVHKKHMGSTVARKFCIQHQPLICIGGHIHEGIGQDKLKNTTIINAGYGNNINTLLEIQDNKIKKIEFYENNQKIK